MRVFKRIFCKLTVLFEAARFFIWPETSIVSIIRSRVRETSPNGPPLLSYGFRRELNVFRQRNA